MRLAFCPLLNLPQRQHGRGEIVALLVELADNLRTLLSTVAVEIIDRCLDPTWILWAIL